MFLRTRTVVSSVVLLAAPLAAGGEIAPESRDSGIVLDVSNLGPNPGYVGGGIDDIELDEAGLTSSDDMLLIGDLHYGPDAFGRINSGSYEGIQDVTFEPGSVRFDIESFASVTGDASPLVEVRNESFFYFSVSETTVATLDIEYDGATNVGNDEVALRLRRVGSGSDPDVLETLYTLANEPDGSDRLEIDIDLIEGARYRLYLYSRARSLNDSGPFMSELDVTITLACEADLDASGSLDFGDVSAFLGLFAAGDLSVDFDGSGALDFADVSEFLALFAQGCP